MTTRRLKSETSRPARSKRYITAEAKSHSASIILCVTLEKTSMPRRMPSHSNGLRSPLFIGFLCRLFFSIAAFIIPYFGLTRAKEPP